VRSVGLVNRHAASWHLNAVVEVRAFNAAVILPAWGVVGVAWLAQSGLRGAREARLDALQLDWSASRGALNDLLLSSARHRDPVFIAVDRQVLLLSAVFIVRVVDTLDVTRLSGQHVVLEVSAASRLVEGLLRGVVVTLVEVEVAADTAQFSLQRAPRGELRANMGTKICH